MTAEFDKGHAYLVYGRRLQNGEIYVASSGARIYGTVFRYSEASNPHAMVRKGAATVSQKIAIRGTQKNYEVAVDARGKFEIPAIPPGRYTIVLESNETVNIRPPHLATTFDLADKACARFSFWIDPLAKVDPGVQSAPRTDLHN